MFRRIFFINLGLIVIAGLMGFNVYKLWHAVINGAWKEVVPVSAGSLKEHKPSSQEEVAGKPVLYSYDVIADKDLFRPERTEWLPPPPEPENSDKKNPAIPQYPSERNQQALSEPTLYGILITGNKKSALMKGSIREEPKKQSRTVRLGNGEVREVPLPPIPGRIANDKTRVYHVGDEVSESAIVDILPDRVILSKNGEEYELILREQAKLAKNIPTPGRNQPKNRDDMQGDQPFLPPELEEFPNLPEEMPAYPPPSFPSPPPGFPAFQPPQEQMGQPGFGYPAFPQPGGVPGVPMRPPFPQFPGQAPMYAPPGFQPPFQVPPGGVNNPFFRNFPGGN